MAKRSPGQKTIRPLRSEADYDAALAEIERYFDEPPEPGTPAADRFDLLALVIEDYERKAWPIEPPSQGQPTAEHRQFQIEAIARKATRRLASCRLRVPCLQSTAFSRNRRTSPCGPVAERPMSCAPCRSNVAS